MTSWKQELDYSKTTRADEVAELIKEARGFGDPQREQRI